MRNPAGGLFANPYRNSNPFLLTMEVDWAPVPNPANMEEDGTNAPPPIPLKPGTLRSTESPNSAQCPRVTGGMNTDIFQGHVGNHGGQDDHPAQGIIGSTNRTPRLSGPRPSKAPDMSHGALSSGYLEKTGNNTGDLLGSGMDEEVSWKPLLQ